MRDYYKILKINHFAPDHEIKQAFRNLAKRWHPDQNHDDKNSAEIFKLIHEAYSVLSNPVLKSDYDHKLKIYMLHINEVHVKEETSETESITIFNKIRTAVEDLIFEDEYNAGYLKQKFLHLSRTDKIQKLRAKIIDFIYEKED